MLIDALGLLTYDRQRQRIACAMVMCGYMVWFHYLVLVRAGTAATAFSRHGSHHACDIHKWFHFYNIRLPPNHQVPGPFAAICVSSDMQHSACKIPQPVTPRSQRLCIELVPVLIEELYAESAVLILFRRRRSPPEVGLPSFRALLEDPCLLPF
ncbi:hypothetical protein FOZ63_030719 [Perkinsus olseni]|uniref:Uncharacterized protein n=1 Tax=Perkinsus olseni TaxID=32597 RepID=A0A7J6PWM1_PEROL|nr:hypothetical protein FOZ63_030719 [Perkinsus olseni]